MLITVAVFVALLVLACVTDLADDRRLGRRQRRGAAADDAVRPPRRARRDTWTAADAYAWRDWADLDTAHPGRADTGLPVTISGAVGGGALMSEGELARRLLSHQLPAADYRRAMERLAAAGSVRYPLAPPA